MRRALLSCLLLACLLLTACGFQLRGSYSLPYDSIYVALPDTNPLRLALKRSIEVSTPTRIVDDPKGAQAVLKVISDEPAKNILSISSAGRVAEYQLVRTFTFRLEDGEGRELLPTGSIVIRRDETFSDAAVLSKEAEEALLWRDIQADLVQQLQRRLSAKPKPVAQD